MASEKSENSTDCHSEWSAQQEQLFSVGTKLGGEDSYFPSVLRPVVLMVASVFLIELIIEYTLRNFLSLSLAQHVLVDAGSTVLLLLPIFYFLLYRPFKKLDIDRRQIQYENNLLSRKLIWRIEEERRRLARDLHDDFGQVLTALQFGVATLKESCRMSSENNQDCDSQAERLTSLIANLGDQVRSFTVGLRPAILEELGLKEAIQFLLEEDWTGLKIKLEEQGSPRRYAPEIELAFFRICQEALRNVAQHAQATRVEIEICHGASELGIRINDNGQGFDAGAIKVGTDRRRGLGLLGMRERIASIGGQLELASTPGRGTIVMAKTPKNLPRRRDGTDPDSDC